MKENGWTKWCVEVRFYGLIHRIDRSVNEAEKYLLYEDKLFEQNFSEQSFDCF